MKWSWSIYKLLVTKQLFASLMSRFFIYYLADVLGVCSVKQSNVQLLIRKASGNTTITQDVNEWIYRTRNTILIQMKKAYIYLFCDMTILNKWCVCFLNCTKKWMDCVCVCMCMCAILSKLNSSMKWINNGNKYLPTRVKKRTHI